MWSSSRSGKRISDHCKPVDFSANEETHKHPSCDKDGYPLAGVDEVDNAKQSQVIGE